MLAPGRDTVTASAPGMAAASQSGLELHVGGSMQLQLRLRPAGRAEHITVVAPPALIDPDSGEGSQVIDEQAIADLPLNGRRFTDLALLSPGVTQDPRGLTSGSNGDLSYGGTRGYQNSFLVDGTDNNNSFFAQARGRYRAPYQFSNEVIKEFRVSSNGYSAELGRAGERSSMWSPTRAATTGTAAPFSMCATTTSMPSRPTSAANLMSSSGNSVGLSRGPLRKDRAFLYLGYDQRQLTVPSIMQFGNGASSVVPQAADYDRKDKDLVFAAAAQLNGMAGEYLTQMGGNAGFAKLDLNLSSRHLLFFRLSPSRYSGSNNVFFDPASPITTYAETSNGIEDVKTESLAASWTSTWTNRLATNLRAQFSRNEQQSFADSDDPKIKIYNLVDGIGRSNILPRETSEHKLHIADTVSYNNGRMNWKFGGDFLQGWIYNYYPAMFGGEFHFDNVKVNPWFFTPMKYGDLLTPLRADAHGVPRYYMQDFGTAVSHPNSRSYALFAQNGIRVTRSLTVNAGLRYDLQTFEVPGLVSNPLYAPSGHIPTDTTNFSPRVGFTYAIRERHPIVLRGGFGRFYSLIPAMYASKVENGTGMTQTQLFLDIMKPADAAIFPNYPNALVNCPSGATTCATPASVASHLTTQVSAFSPNFQTPYTEQASLTLEFGIGANPTASASYLYVHGERLIRSLDANLPKPKVTEYPVYDEQSVFTGDYYSVASFATWQTKRTRWTARIGPGYFTVDVRLSKGFQLGERVRLTLLAESFNVSNRVNQRVDISDDGFLNSAGQFIAYSTKAGKTLHPGEFVKNSKFLIPTNSYAPRQVQFPIKASF